MLMGTTLPRLGEAFDSKFMGCFSNYVYHTFNFKVWISSYNRLGAHFHELDLQSPLPHSSGGGVSNTLQYRLTTFQGTRHPSPTTMLKQRVGIQLMETRLHQHTGVGYFVVFFIYNHYPTIYRTSSVDSKCVTFISCWHLLANRVRQGCWFGFDKPTFYFYFF